MTHLLLRDLYGYVRKGRTYALIVVGILVPALVLMRWWPTGGVLAMDVDLGPSLFRGMASAQLLFLVLVLPGIAGVAISAEREQHTLGMLTATALDPGAIVLAKSLSAAILVLSIVFAGIPVLALTVFLGSVPPSWIMAHFEAAVCGAFGIAAVGVFTSSLMSRSAAAIPVSYAVCVAYVGILYLAGIHALPFLGVVGAGDGEAASRWLVLVRIANSILCFSVLSRLGMASGSRSVVVRVVRGCGMSVCLLLVWLFPMAWHQACLLGLLLGICSLPLTGRFLMGPGMGGMFRRRGMGEVPGADGMGEAEAKAKAAGFSGRMNPVFVAERQTRLLGKRGALVRIAYFAAIGSQLFLLLLTLRLDWLIEADSWVHVAVQIFVFFSWLICGMLSATSLPSERERLTLPLLQTSMLSMRDIALGKWLGSFWYGQIFMVAALPLLVNAALTETIPVQVLVRYGLAMIGGVLMASSMGMWIALTSRRTAVAVGRWLTLTACLFGVDWATAHAFLPRLRVGWPTPWGQVASAYVGMHPQQESVWSVRLDPFYEGLGPGLSPYAGELWLLAVALVSALITWLLVPWAGKRWGGAEQGL